MNYETGMRKLTDVEKYAFKRIHKSSDGAILIQYLSEALQEQDKNNRTTAVETVQKGQGKAQLLAELIDNLIKE